jgi:hypothetical protein
MSKPSASDPRRVYKTSPSGVTGVILVAFGVALLVGLATGLVWILFNLL